MSYTHDLDDDEIAFCRVCWRVGIWWRDDPCCPFCHSYGGDEAARPATTESEQLDLLHAFDDGRRH